MPLAEPSDTSLLCTFINLNVSEREGTESVSHAKTIECSFVTGTWHEPVTGLPFKSQRMGLRLRRVEDVETAYVCLCFQMRSSPRYSKCHVTSNKAQEMRRRQISDKGGGFEGVRSGRTSLKKLLPPQAMRGI
jgi:hypothetical protein